MIIKILPTLIKMHKKISLKKRIEKTLARSQWIDHIARAKTVALTYIKWAPDLIQAKIK